MQACTQCRHHNSSESIFCSQCGYKLNNNCPACGFKNHEQQNFCGSCGKHLRTQPGLITDEPAARLQPSQKTKTEPDSSPAQVLPLQPTDMPDSHSIQSRKASHPVSQQPSQESPVLLSSQNELIEPTVETHTSVVTHIEEDVHPLHEAKDVLADIEQTTSIADATLLKSYAKASIDIVNWEQIELTTESQDQLTTLKEQVEELITAHLETAGSLIETTPGKTSVWQVLFQQQPSLLHSLQAGIDACLQLLKKPLRLGSFYIQLRVGIGIENLETPSQLTATLERSVSLPGALTVSSDVYNLVQHGYAVETVGPIPLGQQSKLFYRILPFHTEKQPSKQTTDQNPEEHQTNIKNSVPLPATEAHKKPSTQKEDNDQLTFETSDVEETEKPPEESASRLDQDSNSNKTDINDSTDLESSGYKHPTDKQQNPEQPVETFTPSKTEEEKDHLDEASLKTLEEVTRPLLPIEEQAPDKEQDEQVTTPNDWYKVSDSQEEEEEYPDEPLPAADTTVRIDDIQETEIAEPPSQSVHQLDEEPPEAETFSIPQSMLPPPTFLDYRHPSLSKKGTAKAPNLSYQEAVNSLSTELRFFLEPPNRTATQQGKLLFLYAEDGLGKSSITNIVRAAVDPENQKAIWMGAHHYRRYYDNASMPLLYWIELIQNLVSMVFEGQPRNEVNANISQLLNQVFDNDIPSHYQQFLQHFLSATPLKPLSLENKGTINYAVNFLFSFLTQLASKNPLIIIMEDLMFADPASLDIWAKLLDRNILDYPIVFISTASPDFETDGTLASSIKKGSSLELVISNLSDIDTEIFLNDGPFGGKISQFSPLLISQLIEHADGNTLYLEESVRLLHLQEILTLDPETGKFIPNKSTDPASAYFPEGWDALMQERLGYLDEQSFYLLKLASVLGEKFPLSALVALVQIEQEPFNEIITELFNQGYLVPDAVHTARFRHSKIWQFIYNSIEPDLKIQFHQLISESLQSDLEQGITVNPMLIAYHAETGGLLTRAMEYWNLSGVYTSQLGVIAAMNIVMIHGLNLLHESGQKLHTQDVAIRSAETLGVYNLDYDLSLAISLLEWVTAVKKDSPNPIERIEPIGFLASAYENKGNITQALSVLEDSIELIEVSHHPLEWITQQLSKLEYLLMLGRAQSALDALEKDIEPVLYNQKNYNTPGSDYFDLYLQAQYSKAQVSLTEASTESLDIIDNTIDCLRLSPEELSENGLYIMLKLIRGHALLQQGKYSECNQSADHLLAAIESLEEPDWFLGQWGLLAIQYHCEFQDWESAAQLVLTVLSKSELVQDYQTNIMAQAYAGKIAAKTGKKKEAQQLIEKAVERSAEHRFAGVALLCWRILAEFELDQSNDDLAYTIATKAIGVAQKPDINHRLETLQLTLLAARALLAKGELKQGGKLLEKAWPTIYTTDISPLIASAATAIGILYKKLAEETIGETRRKNTARSVEFFLKAKGLWMACAHQGNTNTIDRLIPKL